jgi:hypothetical protein
MLFGAQKNKRKKTINSGKPLGVGNLEWGGDGEGMRRGRTV